MGIQKVWYRTSHLDSTLFTVDENGDVVTHTIYDPWGNPLTDTHTDLNYTGLDNRNNYTGYTWDVTLELYFAQARFYDAENHRFTQEDPVKDGGNWYVYVGNNPENFIDVTGTLIEELRVWYAGDGLKTVDQLATEGVRWVNWENLFSEAIGARINALPDIKDTGAYNFVVDEIIYQEAEKLQSEFQTVYSASSSNPLIPSSIVYETINPLYTELARPKNTTLWDVAAKGFSIGFSYGLSYSVVQASAEQQYTIDTGKNPWSQDPWARGNIVDDAFGNNLGHNFPTVDRLDPTTKELFSFKSYDTAAQSYQSTSGFFSRLKCDIDSLAGFTSRTWKKKILYSTDYTSKVFQIGIPERALSSAQSKALADAIVYAGEQGIKFVIKVVK